MGTLLVGKKAISFRIAFDCPQRNHPGWFTLKGGSMFRPSPHLSDFVNRRIVQSEVEGGVHLGDLPAGAVLEIETENRFYTMEYRGLNQALLSGHPVFCPEPTLVTIAGSTWGG